MPTDRSKDGSIKCSQNSTDLRTTTQSEEKNWTFTVQSVGKKEDSQQRRSSEHSLTNTGELVSFSDGLVPSSRGQSKIQRSSNANLTVVWKTIVDYMLENAFEKADHKITHVEQSKELGISRKISSESDVPSDIQDSINQDDSIPVLSLIEIQERLGTCMSVKKERVTHGKTSTGNNSSAEATGIITEDALVRANPSSIGTVNCHQAIEKENGTLKSASDLLHKRVKYRRKLEVCTLSGEREDQGNEGNTSIQGPHQTKEHSPVPSLFKMDGSPLLTEFETFSPISSKRAQESRLSQFTSRKAKKQRNFYREETSNSEVTAYTNSHEKDKRIELFQAAQDSIFEHSTEISWDNSHAVSTLFKDRNDFFVTHRKDNYLVWKLPNPRTSGFQDVKEEKHVEEDSKYRGFGNCFYGTVDVIGYGKESMRLYEDRERPYSNLDINFAVLLHRKLIPVSCSFLSYH